MNPSVFLVAVLALCTLSSALLSCNHCVPTFNGSVTCADNDHLQPVNCSENATHCARTRIEVKPAGKPDLTLYVFGCLEVGCDLYNSSVCGQAATNASLYNTTILSCKTACTLGNNTNTLPEATTSASVVTTKSSNDTDSTQGPYNDAAGELRPMFALLFLLLLVVV